LSRWEHPRHSGRVEGKNREKGSQFTSFSRECARNGSGQRDRHTVKEKKKKAEEKIERGKTKRFATRKKMMGTNQW